MAQDDAIRIDIEVSTQSVKEIQDILKEIRAGEERLQRIRTETTTERLRKRKSSIPEIGGAPGDIGRVEIESGGIFGGQEPGEALPEKGRVSTFKEPIQRENRFKQLEQQVEEQRSLLAQLGGVGGTAVGLIGSLKSGPVGFIEKIFKNPIGKAAIAAAVAQALIEQIAEILQSPGNIFDRRYRRMIKDEATGLLSRADQAQLRQGFRTIRVTSRPGLRGGQGQTFSNLEALRRGIPLYDLEFEAYSKGLYK